MCVGGLKWLEGRRGLYMSKKLKLKKLKKRKCVCVGGFEVVGRAERTVYVKKNYKKKEMWGGGLKWWEGLRGLYM
jgi:hypothetical protein